MQDVQVEGKNQVSLSSSVSKEPQSCSTGIASVFDCSHGNQLGYFWHAEGHLYSFLKRWKNLAKSEYAEVSRLRDVLIAT